MLTATRGLSRRFGLAGGLAIFGILLVVEGGEIVKDRTVVLEALNQSGAALAYADESLRADETTRLYPCCVTHRRQTSALLRPCALATRCTRGRSGQPFESVLKAPTVMAYSTRTAKQPRLTRQLERRKTRGIFSDFLLENVQAILTTTRISVPNT